MSTTSLTAGEIMDRAAALLNDPAKTDYTYITMLPYLNMAIDEMALHLEESNSTATNITYITTLPVGSSIITPLGHETSPHYPDDIVEIQEIGQRMAGTEDEFTTVLRRDFIDSYPPIHGFLYYTWEIQILWFNPRGSLSPRDIRIRYVREANPQVLNETSLIKTVNSRSYLAYKTAALCAMFIGENETRAKMLEQYADTALEMTLGINTKGRQQIMTRHRPFRAGWKTRGGF